MKSTVALISLFSLSIIGFQLLKQRTATIQEVATVTPPAAPTTSTCIPTFVDGGGPYYQPDTPLRRQIAPTTHNGEKLVVSGKVLAKDCTTPLSNVIVDVWQANESGNYDDEWYRGRVETNTDGEYEFETVVPKGYGEGSGVRPPHIHFKIWQDGRELITSQMFLPASRAQGIEEAYIMELETAIENGKTFHVGSHDIVLP